MSQRSIIEQAARSQGIPPSLLWGVYGAETNFGRNVQRSSAGAVGPFQFMPTTARGLGIDPLNFRQAAFGAAKYLAPYYKSSGARGALTAYNAGPGRVGGPLPAETRAYIPRVLQLAKTWGGGQALLDASGGGSGAAVTIPGVQGAQGLPQGSDGTVALLTALAQQRPQLGSAGVATPGFAAGPRLAGGTPWSMGGPAPPPDMGSLLALARTAQGDVQNAPSTGAMAVPGAAGGAGGRYVNPFQGSLVSGGRIDEGVDPTIRGPIRAIGDAKVVNISHNFYKGQPYIVYQLQSGPHAGKYVYVSELVTPHVKVGQSVRAGDVIATGHGPIETGWAGGAKGSYLPLANRAQGGGYTEGKVTGWGKAFEQFLRSLGVHAGPR